MEIRVPESSRISDVEDLGLQHAGCYLVLDPRRGLAGVATRQIVDKIATILVCHSLLFLGTNIHFSRSVRGSQSAGTKDVLDGRLDEVFPTYLNCRLRSQSFDQPDRNRRGKAYGLHGQGLLLG